MSAPRSCTGAATFYALTWDTHQSLIQNRCTAREFRVKALERLVDRTARRFGIQIARTSSMKGRLPVEASRADAEIIAGLRPFTMTSAERLWVLLSATRYVCESRISGEFVECGVWRGGSVMAMAQALLAKGVTDRNIWLYDTFTGMTDPTEKDIEAGTGITAEQLLQATPIGDGDNVWCIASRSDVETNVLSTGYPRDKLVFIEGDVVQTLTQQTPDSIALLRLYTDWYESTRVSLETLYPKLVPGGICILDDYGHWKGARDAVDEYFASTQARPLMLPIDYSGRIFIKPASE